jgi:hypothetical protein
MACTGMTWDQVLDDLDLIRLRAINQYWVEHPPVHILIAAYLGIKPKPKTPTEEINEESLKTLVEGVGSMISGRPNDPMLDLLEI